MGGWGKGASGRAARVWAAALASVFLLFGAIHRDVEALAFGVLTVVALVLTLVRRGALGRVGLGFVAVDTLVWMAPATFLNITTGDGIAGPAALTVTAFGVLLLVAGLSPRHVLAIGAALAVAGVLGVVVSASTAEPERAATATVTMRKIAFEPAKIEATGGTDATIAVANRDLFWHTLTLPSLDLEVAVPTGSTRVLRIDAEPGTYEFVCAIPGHEGAGMKGTLTLR